MTPFRRASLDRLRRELPQVVVRAFPKTAHVSILVLAQDEIAAAVGIFLAVQGSVAKGRLGGSASGIRPANSGRPSL